MSDPTTTNKAASIADQLVYDAIFDGVVVLVEAGLVAQMPYLANPIAHKFLDMGVKFIANQIYKQLSTLVVFEIIDLQVGAEENELSKATAALKLAQASKDIDAIRNAAADFKKSLGKLVHYDGSV